MPKSLARYAVWFALWFAGLPLAAAEAPKNVILLIGDGMGFEQVRAAGMYAHGVPGTFAFESFPYQGTVTTYSANNSVTDSAAAATALATGYKVNNGVVSMAYPGDGRELPTLLEHSRDLGKLTGLVTTTYMTHATPACFGAHEPSRNNLDEIAADYLHQTRPNVLFGGGAHGLSPAAAVAAGYTVVSDRSGLEALDPDTVTQVSGQFGDDHFPYEYNYWTGGHDFYDTMPHLSEMTSFALDILDADDDGFFLVVEGGRIDHAGHDNNIRRNIFETTEFARAADEAIAWAAGRDDTLILVTADHETGGLTVLQNNGQGNWPTVSWDTGDHTDADVPIYAWGPNASLVNGVLDNTDLFNIVTVPEPATLMLIGSALVLGRRR
ncbi:MAG: alkaline phosphatase [Planctomycetes bacterium]|nr:alkaline phosphatase [Planctomycetota bacterium]